MTPADLAHPPQDPAPTRGPCPEFQPWLALLGGALLLPFAGGARPVGLAAWLVPMLLLRFLRRQPALRGLGLVLLLSLPGLAFQWRGVLPFHDWRQGGALVLIAFGTLLPYLADRLLAPRLPGLAATLVFPTSLVTAERVAAWGPMGSWGAAGYSQAGQLALCQLVSVTGLAGIAFLIGWSGSMGAWLWAAGWEDRAARRGVWLCAGSIGLVLLLGGLRLALRPPAARTVRVASLARSLSAPPSQLMAGAAPTAAELAGFRSQWAALNAELLARSDREAQAGARIVFWAETSAQTLKVDEPALLAQGQALARSRRIYLGMAIGSWSPGRPKPLENKLLLITPEGAVGWAYAKSHPTPGGDAATCAPGVGRLPCLDTPYGRLSGLICFDADFPRLAAQAGPLGIGLMLDPGEDWPAIDPVHTDMAGFRAIEQGFSLVRHASPGLSAAFDSQGRRLGALDSPRSPGATLVVEVPVAAARTLYSRWGDVFAWACVGGLLALAGWAWLRPR